MLLKSKYDIGCTYSFTIQLRRATKLTNSKVAKLRTRQTQNLLNSKFAKPESRQTSPLPFFATSTFGQSHFLGIEMSIKLLPRKTRNINFEKDSSAKKIFFDSWRDFFSFRWILKFWVFSFGAKNSSVGEKILRRGIFSRCPPGNRKLVRNVFFRIRFSRTFAVPSYNWCQHWSHLLCCLYWNL